MNNKLNDKLIKTKKLSNQKKLFDDIYSTTFKKLGYLDKARYTKFHKKEC